jgi:deoxycytidine triphosphate deaminase
MILTDREIRLEWKDGNIRFEPDIDPAQIGDSSVDLRLSPSLRVPEKDENIIIRPSSRIPRELYGKTVEIPENGYNLPPRKIRSGFNVRKGHPSQLSRGEARG